MKRLLIISLLWIISCGKETHENEILSTEKPEVLTYDTVAIDSFSPGATSVDVARRIKIMSQNYQDSLRKIAAEIEDKKILAKAKEEQEKQAKKLEDDKKKAAAEKAKRENNQTTSANSTEPNP